MPLNQLDVDDAVSQGSAHADQMMQEIERDWGKPYDKAKNAGVWYAFLERIAPGMPGKMIEQKMMESDKAQYNALKQRFMDAMGGKKDG
jgi:hypothetical protein